MFMNLHPLLFTSSPLLRLSFVLLTAMSPLMSACHDEFMGKLNYRMREVQSRGSMLKTEVPGDSSSRRELEEESQAAPSGAVAYSGNYEYKIKDRNLGEWPFFAGGKIKLGIGAKWKLSGEGWRTSNPDRVFFTGYTGVNLEVAASIKWGITRQEGWFLTVPGVRFYENYYYSFEAGPSVEGKAAIDLGVSASYSRVISTTKLSFAGSGQLNAYFKVSADANASVLIRKYYNSGRFIEESVYWKLDGSLAGALNLNTGASAGYSKQFVPNDYDINSFWMQFNGFKCILSAEASAEVGRMKVIARVKHTAVSTNTFMKSKTWHTGSPS